MGKLGNQMFQYATLYAVAKENNYDFGVPHSQKNNTNDYHTFRLPKIFHLSAKDSSNINNLKRFVEKRHDFDPDIFSIQDDTDIYGYFQTEKYFKKYKEEIKKEFEFPEKISSFCKSFRKTIPNEKVISLHVRRGDYLAQQQNHPVCDKEYYQEAMNVFDKESCFLIFSDDVPWCMENFSGEQFRIFQNNDTYSLCMMSLCDGHIIANSSYSWWGAWLGNVENVVAPKKWFGDSLKHKNVEDTYCEGWVVI
jgi:hypothetical protein